MSASVPVSARPTGLVNGFLFLATVLTTTATGALHVHADGRIAPIADGLPFSVPLLAILLCHEFGHYFAARRHGVPASLPYFVPLPPWFGFLGTMGAVIRMPESPADRRKLFDIAVAGPLAGLVVAIPVLIYGLSKSPVLPMSPLALQEGNSLLYLGLKYLQTGRWLPDGVYDVQLHPTAFAGWAGLLLTMLNLLPFGQLDGGHAMVARFGNTYPGLSVRLHKLMLVFAVGAFAFTYVVTSRAIAAGGMPADGQGTPLLSPGELALSAGMFWVLWFAVVRLLRRLGGGVEHPPVESVPLGRVRKAVFVLVSLLFVSIFMPIPVRVSVGPPVLAPASAKVLGSQASPPPTSPKP